MATKRNHCLLMAKLAQQAKRYNEMAGFMETLASTAADNGGGDLTPEERDLLAEAYKNETGKLRAALRFLAELEFKEDDEPINEELLTEYRLKLETELSDVCDRVLKVLDMNLLPFAESQESQVFYLKLKGDYYRYHADFKEGDARKLAVENALSAYMAAQEIAVADLSPAHPVRLGLGLNLSVFYYETQMDSAKASSFAEEAYEDAISERWNLQEEYYKSSVLILQRLKENMALWNSNVRVS